jgi:hypothetical protein
MSTHRTKAQLAIGASPDAWLRERGCPEIIVDNAERTPGVK